MYNMGFETTAPKAKLVPHPKARLREQVREVMRFHHYSERTETAYWQWIKRFIFFHGKRHPRELGARCCQPPKKPPVGSGWASSSGITGGKIMSSSRRDVKSRTATALRLAAQGLNKTQNYFGDLYRRWKARLGTPKAITAMAHKLARIRRHLCKYRQAFDPEVFKKGEEKMQRKKIARLHNSAAALGLKLVPN